MQANPALYVKEMFYPKLSEITSTVTEYIRLSLCDLHVRPPADALLCALCRAVSGKTLQCVYCILMSMTKLCAKNTLTNPTFCCMSARVSILITLKRDDTHASH